MAGLFSLVALLSVIGFGVWYMTSTMTPPDSSSATDGELAQEGTMLDAVKEAERLKGVMESRSANPDTPPVPSKPLITLDYSGEGLVTVPTGTFSRTDIEVLDLSKNALTGALPAEVRHLINLRILDLSHNQFTGVPAEIGQLSKLEVLDLSYNKLTGLPYELGNLKNLKVLDLRGNNYSSSDLEIIKKGLPSSVEIRIGG